MRSGCFIHILIIYYFFSVVQYPAEIDKKNFRETVSPHFALKGTIRLNKRNSNIPSRERKDSVTETERRGMQQGFPVRKDADRSIDPPVNRPDGPREVPLSLRQGKIPVREDAATGRTFPVLNRFGKKPDAVPVTEEPVVETEIEPVTDESAMETEPEAVVDEPAVEAEPEAVVDVPATEAEPEAVVDSPAVEAEPEAVVDEPAVEAEPEATVEEPVVEAEPEPVVDEPISEAEPEPVTEEPAVEAEPEPVDDDPLEPPVFIQKKRTAYVQALDEPVQTEDPLEATRVFDKVPPAVVPAVPEEPMSADTGSDTTGNGSKKLWILPLLIAILAAVAGQTNAADPPAVPQQYTQGVLSLTKQTGQIVDLIVEHDLIGCSFWGQTALIHTLTVQPQSIYTVGTGTQHRLFRQLIQHEGSLQFLHRPQAVMTSEVVRHGNKLLKKLNLSLFDSGFLLRFDPLSTPRPVH